MTGRHGFSSPLVRPARDCTELKGHGKSAMLLQGSSSSSQRTARTSGRDGAAVPVLPLLGTEQLQVALDVVAATHGVVDAWVHLLEAAGVAGEQVRPHGATWRRAQLLQRAQLLLQQAPGRAFAVGHAKIGARALLSRQLGRVPRPKLHLMICTDTPPTLIERHCQEALVIQYVEGHGQRAAAILNIYTEPPDALERYSG